MLHTFVLIRRDTGEPDGVISTHLDALDDFDYNRETHELIEVEPDHPIFSQTQRHFCCREGKIMRKDQTEIDALKATETARRMTPMRSIMDDLLDLLNETRTEAGLPIVTMEQIQQRRAGRHHD